jgi:hypothetical protein
VGEVRSQRTSRIAGRQHDGGRDQEVKSFLDRLTE